MVGNRGNIWKSSSPAILIKKLHPQQFVQDYNAQVGFENLRQMRLHNLSGKPAPGWAPGWSPSLFSIEVLVRSSLTLIILFYTL